MDIDPLTLGPVELMPPLVLMGDGDLAFYRTPEAVALAVEPVDAQDIAWQLFDARGVALKLVGIGVTRTRWTVAGGRTVVTVAEPFRREPDVLVDAIRSYLARAFGITDAGDDLAAISAAAVARIGYERV